MTDTLVLESTETVTTPQLDDQSWDKFTHIVHEGFWKDDENKEGWTPAGPAVAEGIVFGTPVKALCGKQWVPNDDPKRYPLCPTCKDIAKAHGWKVPSL